MGGSVGTIFCEIDLDSSRFQKSQKRLYQDATSTSLSIEDNFRKMGIKSSAEFELMRRKATNAFEMIKNSSLATSNDIMRAEKAKAEMLTRINEQQFGKQTSMLQSIRQHWMAYAAAATAAFYVIERGISSSVRAYMVQEDAVNKMSVAMKNQGDFSRAGLKGMLDYAAGIQRVTAYGDEATLSLMANLKSYGMNDEMLKRATQTALDFASAKKAEGLTITTAGELIGKAYLGQTQTLTRYGIVIDSSLTGAKKFEAVMEQLNSRFGGAAAADLDTYRGKWTQLGNLWGDVKEDIGAMVLKIADDLMPVLQKTVDLFGRMARAAKEAFGTDSIDKQRQAVMQQIRNLESTPLTSISDRLNKFFGHDVAAERKAQLESLHEQLRLLDEMQRWKAPETAMPSAAVAPGLSAAEIKKAMDETVKLGEAQIQAAGDYEAMEAAAYAAYDKIGSHAELTAKREQFAWKEKLSVFKKTMSERENFFRASDEAMIKETQLSVADEVASQNYVRDYVKTSYNDMSDEIKNATTGWASHFASEMNDVLWGANTTFEDIATSFARMITQIVIQTQIVEPVLKSLFDTLKSSSSGGGGGPFGFLGEIFGGLSKIVSGIFGGAGGAVGMGEFATAMSGTLLPGLIHEGGIIGEDSFPKRLMPGAMFLNAPRLHSGLAWDEYPAILQRGETVTPKGGMTDKGVHIHLEGFNLNISALDSVTGVAWLERNPQAVLRPFVRALQQGNAVRDVIREVL